MTALLRSLRLLAGTPAALLVAGIGLAILAEGSSIGLLGLSGWFIAACALAGRDRYPGFSYLTPSGGVRALALLRIAARYAERLVTHAATLRWLTRLRVRLFTTAARARPEHLARLRSGEALDRAMRDAGAVDDVLLRTVVPAAVAAAGVAGAVALLGTLSAPVAGTLLVSALVIAVVAVRAGAGAPTSAAHRGAARAHLVAAVDAWPEMLSLGAVRTLRRTAQDHLDALAVAEAEAQRRASRATGLVDGTVGAGVAAVLGVALTGPSALALPDLTLAVLLSGGVLELVAGLVHASRAARDAAVAADRLAALDGPAPPAPLPATRTGTGLPVEIRGVRPAGAGERLDLVVDAGGVAVLSGRSGSGKTTLLRMLAGEHPAADGVLRVAGHPPEAHAPGQIVFVAHDDHLFTGTVADNIRLADPDADDDRVEELLRAVGLDTGGIGAGTTLGVGGRAVSGGEARRLCLARAIARSPRLLLLDEPTEGVDTATARAALARMRELLPTTTVVAAIHDTQLGAVPWRDAVRLSLTPPAGPLADVPHPALAPRPGR